MLEWPSLMDTESSTTCSTESLSYVIIIGKSETFSSFIEISPF